jgi:hypothetical protein
MNSELKLKTSHAEMSWRKDMLLLVFPEHNFLEDEFHNEEFSYY